MNYDELDEQKAYYELYGMLDNKEGKKDLSYLT